MQILDSTLIEVLNQKLSEIEEHFEADAIFYFGEIHPALVKFFRDFIEKIKDDESTENKDRLCIILNTPGGSAETVEKMVDIVRFHYKEVYFIVPDYAMSAGTIFCMSGDKIFMDYSSSLGPIDPQVEVEGKYVPALGYLDKVNELIDKSRNNELTQAEFLILQNLDLAMLRSYEQARELSISLLKEWLVKYKFKSWTVHRSNLDLKGSAVTKEQKMERAEEIARLLGNNNIWHTHGRFLSIDKLRTPLKLEIEDFSNDTELRGLIRSYNDLICEFIARRNMQFYFHSKNHH